MNLSRFFTKTCFTMGVAASFALAQQSTTGQTGTRQSEPSQSQSTGKQGTSGDRTHAGHSGTASTANEGGAGGAMVGKQDHQFMVEAAQGGQMEVQLADLAMQKASSDEVKQFAQQLKTDHSEANKQLQALASRKGVQLPAEMGPKHQNQLNKFQNMSGEQFDRAYIRMQVQHHRQDVNKFQKHVERSMDSDVKQFAQSNLPVLQKHLEQAQQLETSTRSRRADRQGSTAGTSAGSERSSETTNKPKGQNNPTTEK
jgi:putative membrane protein